jgi:perosamine synthetase
MKDRIKTISIAATSTIRQAMRAIDQGALGVALLEEPGTGTFVGLVTDGDIRRALLNGHGLESFVLAIPRPISKTARAGASPEEIASLFDEHVRVIPLLNEKNLVVDLAIYDRRAYIPVAEPALTERELLYVSECVLTGWISSAGKFVSKFEEMFAAFCGAKYAIATANGTAALHLAVLASGIGAGDEVIVPTLTFIATANAVTYTGARPVFVDSEWDTWNINPEQIEAAITSRTKAIIPVHLYGHPARMSRIMDIAARYGLMVIEDAAEAHGALCDGCPVGGIGNIGVFSFYGNKIVTTGEGGMVVTDDPAIAEKVQMARDHGMSSARRYWHPILGYNYRLTNLQAAVGVAQMEQIDSILQSKQRIAKLYCENLQDIPGVELPPAAAWATNVYWLYSILVKEKQFGITRDDLMERLKEQGIDTRSFFPPVHTQPIYHNAEHFPVAESLAASGINLPSFRGLTESDIIRISNAIRSRAR